MAVATEDLPHEPSSLAVREQTPSGLVTRLTRCMGVSVITTVISVSILVAATAGFGLAAWLANVTATAVATVPSYHLNRRWTWGKRDASSVWREVAPFWALSFLGLVLSTIAVALTDSWTHGLRLGSPLLHTGFLLAAHLSGFGILWIAQFVLLDRVLFTTRSD
jgi:putative flippase GtrA